MPRRPAAITEAEVKRAIRAGRKAGLSEVEVKIGDNASIIYRLTPSTTPAEPLEPEPEIVL